jgi:hypothetical protein
MEIQVNEVTILGKWSEDLGKWSEDLGKWNEYLGKWIGDFG